MLKNEKNTFDIKICSKIQKYIWYQRYVLKYKNTFDIKDMLKNTKIHLISDMFQNIQYIWYQRYVLKYKNTFDIKDMFLNTKIHLISKIC